MPCPQGTWAHENSWKGDHAPQVSLQPLPAGGRQPERLRSRGVREGFPARPRRDHRGVGDPLCDPVPLPAHHHGGLAGQRPAGEDLHHQQRHEERPQHLHLQPGRRRRAAAAHLRPGGRLAVLFRRVDVREGGLQADPGHPAHLRGGVRVHSHGPQRRQVRAQVGREPRIVTGRGE